MKISNLIQQLLMKLSPLAVLQCPSGRVRLLQVEADFISGLDSHGAG